MADINTDRANDPIAGHRVSAPYLLYGMRDRRHANGSLAAFPSAPIPTVLRNDAPTATCLAVDIGRLADGDWD